jgi:histidinol dehydrogenase
VIVTDTIEEAFSVADTFVSDHVEVLTNDLLSATCGDDV